jgi:hypothetical protein
MRGLRVETYLLTYLNHYTNLESSYSDTIHISYRDLVFEFEVYVHLNAFAIQSRDLGCFVFLYVMARQLLLFLFNFLLSFLLP